MGQTRAPCRGKGGGSKVEENRQNRPQHRKWHPRQKQGPGISAPTESEAKPKKITRGSHLVRPIARGEEKGCGREEGIKIRPVKGERITREKRWTPDKGSDRLVVTLGKVAGCWGGREVS